ncbi:uncharacterized protein YaaQ [Keratinibaculum paraultunense]|uniref:Uncharacterized protein YaaQ n=1 Tax=Keratinibaculum paraultunense TaxID=1278232 RepID=A0A4R3KVJ1_9FIRM|nr:cyclic-di-AMP receptor [Keratinibaculum paraultunense]QQY79870.1 cyclic-di-AMP receptor [Keratinibaculum paraultunense]TCS88756.1 uncharacterized protein YaaQ [Keratinibaculum paraultunense]
MKLIIAVIQDEFSNKVVKALMDNKYRATKLSSTGGFLKSGNTTLLIGVKDDEVDEIIDIIEKECKNKKVMKGHKEINVGGANIFVLNMEDFKKL